MSFTHAEENYLKAIYHLSSPEAATVSTNAVAEALRTKPASVTDMLRKLAAKGLLDYVKYQGASLTDDGRRVALLVIRKHRLWETFLVEKLRFQWDQVHEVAEQLEHIHSPLLIRRLEAFLDYPEVDPHGDPIPNEGGAIVSRPRRPLAEAEAGRDLKVVGVEETSPLFLRYLDKVGVAIGTRLRVLEQIPFDRSLELLIDGQRTQLVSREVSENIYVTGG
ncbi:MAG: metal-dependent transcriptional regulator [Catalinimonas sp.]